jgi:hypothetical protein
VRFLLAILVIGSSLVSDGWAQRSASAKRASTVVTMRSQSQGTLAVSFANAPDGVPLNGTSTQRVLDLGSASYNAAAPARNVNLKRLPGSFVVSTRFGLLVQDTSQRALTATVLAALSLPDPAFVFRLDGVRLATAPQIIQGQAKIGVVFQHSLEIEVPGSVTEKNSHLNNAVVFQVIAN